MCLHTHTHVHPEHISMCLRIYSVTSTLRVHTYTEPGLCSHVCYIQMPLILNFCGFQYFQGYVLAYSGLPHVRKSPIVTLC